MSGNANKVAFFPPADPANSKPVIRYISGGWQGDGENGLGHIRIGWLAPEGFGEITFAMQPDGTILLDDEYMSENFAGQVLEALLAGAKRKP